MIVNSPTPLSNVQVEILKAFSVDLNENELQDFKKNIAQFLLQKIRKEADAQETKKSNTVEVIGKSTESEAGKTKSVKTDPTGFTEVIDAEKFRGKYTSLTDVLEREAGVRVRL